MATKLELDLEALARLSPELHLLAALVKGSTGAPEASTPGNPGVDMPSLVAARPVSSDTIPQLETVVADRFVLVADLVEEARTRFKESSESLKTTITSSGNLLPPTSAPGG